MPARAHSPRLKSRPPDRETPSVRASGLDAREVFTDQIGSGREPIEMFGAQGFFGVSRLQAGIGSSPIFSIEGLPTFLQLARRGHLAIILQVAVARQPREATGGLRTLPEDYILDATTDFHWSAP